MWRESIDVKECFCIVSCVILMLVFCADETRQTENTVEVADVTRRKAGLKHRQESEPEKPF